MYQKRCKWGIGVITLVLSMAACQRAEEPTPPAKETPAATQPAQKAVAPAPLQEFLQKISVSTPVPTTMKAGETVTISVTVKNISKETWPATGDLTTGANIVHFSYHWLGRSGNVVIFEGARTRLPHDVAPGGSVSLDATIQVPSTPGEYTLRLTMLQELVTWFEDRGAQPLDIPVTVTAR